MNPFVSFTLSADKPQRRQLLGSTMPTNEGLAYATILSDAYFYKAGDDTRVTSFARLCELTGETSVLEALTKARSQGCLSEGERELSNEIQLLLRSVGGKEIYVRRSMSGTTTLDTSAYAIDSLGTIVKEARDDEVELCDSHQFWYLRFRDDDPLIFIAAPSNFIDEVVRRNCQTCLKVGHDFVYCM